MCIECDTHSRDLVPRSGNTSGLPAATTSLIRPSWAAPLAGLAIVTLLSCASMGCKRCHEDPSTPVGTATVDAPAAPELSPRGELEQLLASAGVTVPTTALAAPGVEALSHPVGGSAKGRPLLLITGDNVIVPGSPPGGIACTLSECTLSPQAREVLARLEAGEVLVAAAEKAPASAVTAAVRAAPGKGRSLVLVARDDQGRLVGVGLQDSESVGRIVAGGTRRQAEPEIAPAAGEFVSKNSAEVTPGTTRSTVTSGTITTGPPCDQVSIAAAARANIKSFNRCYQQSTAAGAAFAGAATLAWSISPGGRPEGVTLTGTGADDAEFRACIEGALGATQFERPVSEQSCPVSWTINLNRRVLTEEDLATADKAGPVIAIASPGRHLTIRDGFGSTKAEYAGTTPSGEIVRDLVALYRPKRAAVVGPRSGASVADLVHVTVLLRAAGFESILLGSNVSF